MGLLTRQINYHLLLGDIHLGRNEHDKALQSYTQATEIDLYNIEALKGVITCNYELGLYSNTWDLAQSLNMDNIKDPIVFLGFFQTGMDSIEQLSDPDMRPLHATEIRQLEARCNILLNYATANAEPHDYSLIEQIAGNYFQIRNYQNVSLSGCQFAS